MFTFLNQLTAKMCDNCIFEVFNRAVQTDRIGGISTLLFIVRGYLFIERA